MSPFDEVVASGALRTTARVLETLRWLVEHESPSSDEQRLRVLAADLGAMLRELGAQVELIDAPGTGRHVSARFAGREEEAPLLILGHLDTVHPVGTLEERPFRVADGRVTGPGVFDMKAGLAVLLESLGLLVRQGAPRRPAHVLVTCDEETGSETSRSIIERAARDSGAVLVLEPPLPGGAAKTARKGVGLYDLRIQGRAAHAGVEPEQGISAIHELAHQVLALEALADAAAGTTVTVGLARGGTASNVVPASAEATADIRFSTMDEGERVDRAIRSLAPTLHGAKLQVSGGINRPPLERTDAVVALYRRARELARSLGFDLPEGSTGGASDGCFTAALGIATLDGLGVAGGGAHAVNEHILVEDLPRRTALVGRLLETL